MSTTQPGRRNPDDCLAGGGEMGSLMRSLDWSRTPVGSVESWSPALRTTVRILLANRFPHILWWGPQYIQFYNDPYRPVLGTKHPRALGQPASECWSEIWHVIGPLVDTPFHGGPATWDEDIYLEIHRHGFVEETHFTIAYSPVPDETVLGGIGGVLATVHEITEKVVGERRILAIRDLGTRTVEARTAEEACAVAARTLESHARDVPFALIYLIEDDGRRARLAGTSGVGFGEPTSPLVVELDGSGDGWPLAEAIRSEAIQVVEGLAERFAAVPPGPWSDPPDTAVVAAIPSNRPHQPAGVLVAGLSARLRWNESYRGFIELLTAPIATAIATARAFDEEKRRAEALAELDRAKTAFFSNVSHEFRTPLTLLLGPVEDLLDGDSDGQGAGPPRRELLEVVHRNALRLQKLVNTLLDFSRIEAGRIQASYEPVDLAAVTVELASVFRSAIERAGMRLIVDCRPLAEPVFVDRDMWEKIVLNLVSNAFKFTFQGEIEVALAQDGDTATLRVRDTGTGIAADQIPRIFERFHRVEGTRARTHEGTGIGLALVQELVRLHGGTVAVASAAGEGTTFTVRIPLGTRHLPADRIGAPRTLAPTPLGAMHYVDEALRWLPDDEARRADGPHEADGSARANGSVLGAIAELPWDVTDGDPVDRPLIVLADDNADMRDYLRGLLSRRFEVVAVPDGEAALEAVRRRMPELVLTDVMMPKLDGFGLLRRLRSDAGTATIPVVMLSARAGEQARVEGLQAGADDYLVKPFGARELLARVSAAIRLARARREAAAALRQSEERFRTLVTASSDVVYRMNPDWSEMRHLAGREFIADTDEPTTTWLEKYIPPDDRPTILEAIERAIRTKSTFELEHRVVRADGTIGWTFSRAIPILDAGGRIVEWFGMAGDVTRRKQAEQALLDQKAEMERQRRLYEGVLSTTPDLAYVFDLDHCFIYANDGLLRMWGKSWDEAIGRTCLELGYEPWHAAMHDREIDQVAATRQPVRGEVPFTGTFGRRIYDYILTPVLGGDGEVVAVAGITRDVTEYRRIQDELHARTAKVETLLNQAPIGVYLVDADFRIREVNPIARPAFGDLPGGVIGRDFDEVVHLLWEEPTADDVVRIFRHTLETGEAYVAPERTGRRVDRDATEYFEWRVDRITLPDGRFGLVCYFRDISAQVQARKLVERSRDELRESERRTAADLEAMTRLQEVANFCAVPGSAFQQCLEKILEAAIAITGADRGNVQLLDPRSGTLEIAAQRGFEREFLDFFAEVGRGEAAACGTALQAGRRVVVEDILESDLFRGQPALPILLNAGVRAVQSTPLVSSQGNVLGMISTHSAGPRGLSEREAPLMDLLARQAADFLERVRAEEALREADRRKDEFLATLAHELRNPLAPIRNLLEILKMPGLDAATIEGSREMMERQVQQLVRLVDDLLDVSRVMRGKIVLRKERVELARVVARAVETAQPLIDAQGHDLVLDLPSESLLLDADPVRLAQVVGNLLTNAAKYTEPKGHIRVTAGRDGDRALLRVRDTGIGITPEMLPKVFELFVQADHTSTRAQGGLGIGLTLTKNLVEMHGGTVEVRSDGLGRGSEFTVRLPLAVAGPTAPEGGKPAARPQATPSARGRRLLVVDDNADAAESLALLLRLQGHEVRVAHDGPAALAMLDGYHPEMIFLDIGMPGMDGYEVARRLRQRPNLENLYLAALTGWGQEEDRRRTAEAGFDYHLVKPVEPALLEKVLAASKAGAGEHEAAARPPRPRPG